MTMPNGSTLRQIVLGRAIGLLLTTCCTMGFGASPLTYFGFDADSHSTAAQEGMKEIFSGRCFHGGVPIRVLNAAAAKAMPQKEISPGSNLATRGNPSAAVVASPPGRSSGMLPSLPLAASVSNRNGVVLLGGNCFGCHAGVVDGQVVAGLGNTRTDQAAEYQEIQSLLARKDTLAAALRNDAERKEFAEFMAHARASASPFRHARTIGDNFGPYAVWRFGARLADPEKTGMVVSDEKTELETLLESLELPTVDPMPWWLMKYKKRDYWYSDAGPDNAAHFSVNFTTAHPEVNETRATHIQSVAKALAFARDTHSPPFPKSLNGGLVQKGADIFHGRTRPADPRGFTACKTCHGTYTKRGKAPNWDQPGSWVVSYDSSTLLRDVKTDAAYNTTLQTLKPIADHIVKLKVYFEKRGTPELGPDVTVPSKAGYVPPPLVGVWASAPYFHNGSVPTIEAVLSSRERPEIWSRNWEDPFAYDFEKVGLEFRAVAPEEFDKIKKDASHADYRSKEAVELRSIYDTRGFGRGNSGHTFGDRLTADERRAVIEFLKSLSGPDM